MKNSIGKRLLSGILAIVLVLGYIPAPARAAQEDGLCPHHTQHTPECGYDPAAEGKPCGHVHTEECYRSVTECVHTHGDCGYVPAVAEQPCACEPDENGALIHQEGCGYQAAVAGVPCDHVCSEDSGCMKSVLDCRHAHDGDCGYAEAKAETPCTYHCAECASEETPVVEDTASEVESDDNKAVTDPVAAQIAALPTPEEIRVMSAQERSDAYEQVQSAYNAYNALTDTQKALIPNAESTFASLFACFDAPAEPDYTVLGSGTCGEDLTWELTGDGTLTIAGSGPMTGVPVEGAVECIGPWKEYASEIKTLVVEDGVTSIFDQSFVDCTNLEQISIPDSVTEIGAFAFYGCDSLTSVTIPAEVDTIVTGAFAGCAKLTRITVAEDNSDYCDVDGVLFDKAKTTLWTYPAGRKATSYTIPEGVTTIQVSSFTAAGNLTEIILPNGVSEIGNGAFSSCDQLEKITLPDSISRIGHGAFQLCGSLKEVCYTGTEAQWSSVTIEEMNEALTSAQIQYQGQDDSIASGSCGAEGDNLTWALSNDGTLTISGTGAMATYTGVSPDGTQGTPAPWYSDRGSITEIVIQEGVTSIGSWAFNNCTNVTNVSLPDSLAAIGEAAFFGCSGLTEVTIPSSITELGNLNFAYCTGLTSISLPDSLQVIGDNAFLGCTRLRSIAIPESVSYIGGGSFQGCTGLASVNIPSSVASIGMYAFFDCTALKAVTIPDTVMFIGDWAFGFYGEATPYSKIDGFAITTPRVSEGYFYAREHGIALKTQGVFVPNFMFVGVAARDLTVNAYYDNAVLGSIPKGDKVQPYVVSYMNVGEDPDQGLVMGMQDADGTITWGKFSAEELADTSKELVRGWVSLSGVQEVPHGECGDSLTWMLVDGVLTISGTGEMDGMVAQNIVCVGPWKANKDDIRSVVIEEGVTSIGAQCFTYCTNLESVTIPGTVETIGHFAFFGTGLKQVSIPASVREIGHAAFSNCTALERIVAEGSNADANFRVVDGVLYDKDMTRLQVYPAAKPEASFTVPDSVTYIDDCACVSAQFTQVLLPQGLTGIGHDAFAGCANLESISIPSSVSTIRYDAFWRCGSLTEITFAHSSTDSLSIDNNAFGLNSSTNVATKVLVPNTDSIHTAISGYNWTGSKRDVCYEETGTISGTCGENLTWKLTNDGTLTISGTGDMAFEEQPWKDHLNEIKQVVLENGVKSIADFAFADCKKMTSITIPDSVTAIGESAFAWCSSLTSVTIPDRVTAIEAETFCGCTSLTSVTIPNGVTTIGENAFLSCTSLTAVTIPDRVTTIGERAFYYCTGLATVHIPSTVSQIGSNSFGGCTGLKDIHFNGSRVQWNKISTNVDLPSDVVVHCTHIADGTCGENLTWTLSNDGTLTISGTGTMAFEEQPWKDHLNEIKQVVLENGMKSIADFAFADCKKITSITIPEGVTTIGHSAFAWCSNLTSVHIPDSVTAIGNNAFALCASLASVNIPDSVTAIEAEAFCGCASLTSVTIPNGVTTIGYEAFAWCSSLTSVTIPNGVTTIGEAVFKGCTGLTAVTIPDSVTAIGQNAFYDCDGLTEITFAHSSADSLSIDNNAFGLNSSTNVATKVLVPNTDSIHTAISGYNWTGSKRDVCYEETGTISGTCGENLTWKLTNDGTLTISGSGTMDEYTLGSSTAPWCAPALQTLPKKLVLEEGVTSIGDYAFYNCTSLTGELVIPDSLETIGHGAFENCQGLTSLKLGKSLTSIDGCAFDGCTGLTGELVIPDSVVSISNDAFYNCTGLTGELVIPDSVESIGAWAFRNCTGLTGLKLGNGLTSIGPVAFYECTGLMGELVIPDSVESIGVWAFGHCTGLTSLKLGNGLTSIGENAFRDCVTLTGDLVIPDSVESIGARAFAYCTGLTSLKLGNNLTSIDELAFNDCTGLATVHIPSTVSQIAFNSFSGCTGLKDIYFNGSRTLWNQIGSTIDLPGDVVVHCTHIADGICGENLTWTLSDDGTLTISGTGTMAFEEQPWKDHLNEITKIVLENGVESIAENAFSGCEYLTSVTIPNSVTAIGSCAFQYCSRLAEIAIPASVTTIGFHAFDSCIGLRSVTIPDSVTTIGSYAFVGCEKLTSLTISGSVTTICEYTFYGCTSLTSVTIPDSVTTIEKEAFGFCRGLRSVTIPDSVTAIGSQAFCECPSLTSVTIPDSVTSIGSDAFCACTSLRSVTIPDSVITIGDGAFYGCTSLTSVTIPKGITTIEYAAFCGCTALTTVTIPESVTTMGHYAFYGCTSLTSVTIPDRVTTIGQNAFYGCTNLKGELVIPASVTEIGENALNGTSIQTLLFRGTTAPADLSSGLDGMGQLKAIYVPLEALSAYQESCGAALSGKVLPYDTRPAKITIANLTSESVTLQWEPVAGALSYQVVRKGTPADTTTETTFQDALQAGERYTYQVIANLPCGVTGQAAEIVVETVLPDILSITADNGRVVTANFNTLRAAIDGNPDGLVGSFYYMADGAAVTIADSLTGTAEKDGSVFTADWDNAELPEGEYTVGFVLAVASNPQKCFSREETLTVDHSVPARIVGLRADGDVRNVTLSWGIAEELATNVYRVYRKTAGETEYTLLREITGRNNHSYVDTACEIGTEYDYYVVGVNQYGEESEPSETVRGSILPDTEAPRVLRLAPANGVSVHGMVTVIAEAEDNVDVTELRLLISRDGGSNWTELAQGTSGKLNTQLDTTTYPDGELRLKAIARDAEGNESDPMLCTVTVDNTGPEQVTGLRYEATSVTVTLHWNDVSDEDVAYFLVERAESDRSFTSIARVKALGINITGLTPGGAYAYRVTAYDRLGNKGTPSEEITVSTQADTTEPVITKLSPAPGYYSKSIPLSVSAEDDYNIAGVRVEVSTNLINWTEVDSQEFTDLSARRQVSFTLKLDDFDEGSLFVRAVAWDSGDHESNTGVDAPYVQYIVDRTPPAPPEITATGYAGYAEIRWTKGTEADLNRYTVYRSETENGTFTVIASGLNTLNYIDRNVKDNGVYFYKVAVTDQAGNVSERSAAAGVQIAPDTVEPEIISIYPANGSVLNAGSAQISVLARDNSKLDRIVVEYSLDGSVFTEWGRVEDIGASSRTGQWKLPSEILRDDAQITIRAYAVDAAGLESDYVTAEYSVDNQAPGVGTATAVYDDNAVVIRWKSRMEQDLLGYQVYRVDGNGSRTLVGARKAVADQLDYVLTDTSIPQAKGTYTYYIEALDIGGNVGGVTTNSVELPDRSYPKPVLHVDYTMEVGVEYLFDATDSTDNSGITSYHLDFGDGSTTTEPSVVHRYQEVGTYTVVLTVTDDDGNSSTLTDTVTVKERTEVGKVEITVVDQDGVPVADAPVYFDLGETTQTIRRTEGNGAVSFTADAGKHTVGCVIPDNNWLPVMKSVVVRAGATEQLKMIMVRQTMIEGSFETDRMTFDEIVAAGIDISDPENQHIMQFHVQLTYGEYQSTVETSFTFNPITNRVVNRKPVIVDTDDGERRKLMPVGVIKNSGGGGSSSGSGGGGGSSFEGPDWTAVVILDIPAEASFLKEFFDVKLHIVNNAGSEFEMRDNYITLNVPAGLSIVDTVATEGNAVVYVPTIAGQTTCTIPWILRGDEQGDYLLDADYSGVLSQFNETVLTTFRADEPIHVYGKQAVKLLVEANSSSMYGAYYFNLGIMNDSPIEVNMPSVDVIGNVISAYLQGCEEEANSPEVTILGTEVRSETGAIQKLQGDVQVNTLAPGETLVKRFAVYNAVDDRDYKLLKEASVQAAADCGVEIVIREVDMDLFDLKDALEKLGQIRTDPNKLSMYQRIMGQTHYAYVWEALDRDTNLLGLLAEKGYATGKLLFEGKFFYNNEQNKKFTRQLVCTLLQDEAMEQLIADKVDTDSIDIVVKMLKAASGILKEPDLSIPETDKESAERLEMARILEDICGDSSAVRSLASAMVNDDGETFSDRLQTTALAYASAEYGKEMIRMYLQDTNLVSGATMEAYSEAFKEMGDSIDLISKGIKSWNDAAQYGAELANITAAQEESIALLNMLVENCEGGTPMRKELESVQKDIEDVIAAQRNEFFRKLLECGGEEITTEGIKWAMKFVFGDYGKPALTIIKTAFKTADYVFDWEGASDDKHALRACLQMSDVLGRAALKYSLETENETEAIYIMRALKYMVKMRLVGEQTYVDQMKAKSQSDQQIALEELNYWLCAEFSSLDAYLNYLYSTLPAYRDSLFCKRLPQEILRPEAPAVTLDFISHATVESFDSRYEYSYDGGSWSVCDGGPIPVEPKRAGGSLWVRARATEDTLTGNITKLAVPAQPRILGDLAATYDGSRYVVTGLTAGIYRIGFKRGEEPAEQYRNIQVSGSGILTVAKTEKFTQLTLQSPASANSFESLVREVPVENIALPDNACGDDLVWLMDSRGVLTISGTGAMWDYASIGAAPWCGENITGLVLEEGITRIGSNAFAGLRLKGALKLPETLREIGISAFDGCAGLTGTLTIPSGVTGIGDRAFYGCTGLSRTIRIPAATQTLGVNAFGACTRLTAFTVDTGNPCFKAVDGVLYSADGLTLLACPAGKTDMTNIAEGTESIGSSAFDGCVNVKKLTVPTSLTSIEHDAFIGCTNLRDIYYQGTMDAWRQIYGSDCLSSVKMHVLYQILYGNLPKVCTNPNPAYGSSDTLLYLKNPTAVGYTFGGWYLNEELTQKVTSIASGRTEALTLYAKMTPNAYNVRYNGNGANGGTMSVTKAVYDEPFQLALNAFVRKGYTFDGWMRSLYGQEAEFTDGQDITQNLTTVKGGTVNLYAHWNPNPYAVRFDSNGGEGEMAAQEFVYGQSQKLTLGAFTRRGYSFTGWNTQPDGKGTGYANAASIKNLADGETVTEVTLYAMWRANTYTVTFHANGGSGLNTKQTLTYDKPANLMMPRFSRKGYSIDGWMLTPDGDDIACEPLGEVVNLADGAEVRNVDLYAHWRYNQYTIAFHANGGVGEMEPVNRTYNDYLSDGFDTSLPANGFARVGYDFAGWATSARGKVAYADGEVVDKNLTAADGATVILYAIWTPHVYSVEFRPGCDNAAGTMKNLINRKYDTGFALTANAFKRTGYTFVGWSLKPDADVEFTNRQSVLNLTSEQNGIVTLYAVWKANDYTITYKNITAAELGAFGLPRNYSIEQQVFLPGADVVRRDGYTFGGWYTDGYYRNPISSIALGSTGNRTLYAKWTANQYTVVFDSGTLDVGSAEKNYTYGKSFALPDVTSALKFTKPGYRFVGWKTEDGTLLKNKQSVKNLALEGEVTLTAQWQCIEYKITYKNVTAMEAIGCPAAYTVEDRVMLPWLEADVRPGCTFEGWYTDAYYKKPFEDFDAGRTGNLTIYAKWSGTAKTYQVSFDKNDPSATGSMRAMTNLIPGREYTLTANAFSLRGYTFSGWETENARIDTLMNRQKFSSLAQDNASEVTLKAQWEPTEYKITYKNILATDDNADNPTTYTVASDEVFLNDPIRDGYTFGGWYTDTYLRKPFESIPQGEIGNRTVYAKWIANSYTVIFSSGDGEGEPAEKTLTYKYNTTYTLPDVTRSLKFTKPGYQFTGWLVTVSGEPTVLANKARIKNLATDGEVELVAQWKPIAYRITYKNVTTMEVAVSENPTVYTVDDSFNLAEPSRPGCTFVGWFLDSGCRKPVSGIEDVTTGNKTFYAKWTGKASTYSIHYEGNGATSGVMRDQTGLACGKEYALTANAFKRTGYTFLGWSADEYSEVPDLLNRQKVSTLIAEGDTSVTLYAVWAPTEYTIRYRNVTAEEAEINSGAYTVENPVQFNAPQREGFTFLGWYIDGKPVEGTDDRSGNLIVYARWEKAE